MDFADRSEEDMLREGMMGTIEMTDITEPAHMCLFIGSPGGADIWGSFVETGSGSEAHARSKAINGLDE